MHRLQVSYEGSARSVPQARHAVEQALTAWGLEELGWTAALLVSELAANVALHARTAFEVVLEPLPHGGARLEVRDGSRRAPRPRRFGDEATTGRGLHLVEDLSADWGVSVRESGKTVWVEIAPHSPSARAREDDGDVDLDALLLSFPDLGADSQDAPRACAA